MLFGCTFGHTWRYLGAHPAAPKDKVVAMYVCRRCGEQRNRWFDKDEASIERVLFGEP